ncbi:MAG TPA: hypothetical protein VKT22_12825 [Steroidobacteraceae bacterium]|nr:hypothetical protein [Steroidobacteraceae bacterium]
MRLPTLLMLMLLAACAREELATKPASAVDLSGQWKLNVADSDDPMRLTQAALAAQTAGAGPGGTTAPTPSGRGQRQAARGGLGPGGPTGPMLPSVMMLDEALRWPGRELAITQGSGGVTFQSLGRDESCKPGAEQSHAKHVKDDPRSHDAPDRGRGDAPPPRCGWDSSTLVVQPRDLEEGHPPYEQAFSLSEDKQRLIEVVTFRGGRSSGFSASRVWDRVPPTGASASSH